MVYLCCVPVWPVYLWCISAVYLSGRCICGVSLLCSFLAGVPVVYLCLLSTRDVRLLCQDLRQTERCGQLASSASCDSVRSLARDRRASATAASQPVAAMASLSRSVTSLPAVTATGCDAGGSLHAVAASTKQPTDSSTDCHRAAAPPVVQLVDVTTLDSCGSEACRERLSSDVSREASSDRRREVAPLVPLDVASSSDSRRCCEEEEEEPLVRLDDETATSSHSSRQEVPLVAVDDSNTSTLDTLVESSDMDAGAVVVVADLLSIDSPADSSADSCCTVAPLITLDGATDSRGDKSQHQVAPPVNGANAEGSDCSATCSADENTQHR